MKQSIWEIFRAARERKLPPAVQPAPIVEARKVEPPKKVEPVMAHTVKMKTPEAKRPTGRRLTIRENLDGEIVYAVFSDHSVVSKTILRQWIKAGKLIRIKPRKRFRIFGNEFYVSECEVAK